MASTKLCILLVSLLWLVGKQTCVLGPVLCGNYLLQLLCMWEIS